MKDLIQQRDDALAEIVKAVAIDDARLVEMSKGARHLDTYYHGLWLLQQSDATIEAHGFSRESLRVAVHAMMPAKEAPLYLTQALDRHKQRHKPQENAVSADHITVNNVQVNGFTPEQLANAPTIELGKVG